MLQFFGPGKLALANFLAGFSYLADFSSTAMHANHVWLKVMKLILFWLVVIRVIGWFDTFSVKADLTVRMTLLWCLIRYCSCLFFCSTFK